MHYGASFWILPDNYDPFWVVIGAVFFGLLFGYYIWLYYQFSRKHSESAPQKKPGYNYHKKVLRHT